jgi:hypothetical protein
LTQPSEHPAASSDAKAWRFFGVLLAIMGGIGGWVFWGQQSRSDAVKAVRALEGKATTYEGGATYLGSVDFAGKPITDADLAPLAPLFRSAEGPQRLDLSGTRITDAGLAHLAGLSYLSTLRLDRTAVTGPGLANLSHMGTSTHTEYGTPIELSLAQTRIDDAALPHLTAITGLTDLDLSGTAVTVRGLRQLQSLRRLNSVVLNGCAITDDDLTTLDG